MPENKDDGGQVYPRIIKETPDQASRLGREPQEFSYPGITRRNKLIDDLVVAIVKCEYAEGLPSDRSGFESGQNWVLKTGIKIATLIADATIAESNK